MLTSQLSSWEMKLRCVACLKFPSCLWVSYGHKNAGLFSKHYPGQSQDPGLSPTHCCETSQLLYHFALFSSSGKRSTTISARQACGAHVWKKSIKLTCSTTMCSHPYVLHIYPAQTPLWWPWHTHLNAGALAAAFDGLKTWAAEPVSDCQCGKWTRKATQTQHNTATAARARWRHLGDSLKPSATHITGIWTG